MCEKWYDFSERFLEPKKEKQRIKFNKLQRQDVSKIDITKLKFKTVIYKTITEILAQTCKTNVEKLQEWVKIQVEYHWLVDIKFDAGLWLQEARKQAWYNKTKEEEIEAIAEELLDMDLQVAKWNYKVISRVEFWENWEIIDYKWIDL